MHELPIVERILSLALHHAQENNAREVISVNLVVGRLSSVVDDSVKFYWDMLTRGTICENTQLNIHRLSAVLECLNCGNQYEVVDELIPCPKCSSIKVKVIQGEEFYLDSIDIEI